MHMVFNDLRHQPGHGAACASDEVQHRAAIGIRFQRPLYGFDLTPESARPGQKFLSLFCRMH